MHLTITRKVRGAGSQCTSVAYGSDAEALTKIWCLLTTERRHDLTDLTWRRSDGERFGFIDLQRWADER